MAVTKAKKKHNNEIHSIAIEESQRALVRAKLSLNTMIEVLDKVSSGKESFESFCDSDELANLFDAIEDLQVTLTNSSTIDNESENED